MQANQPVGTTQNYHVVHFHHEDAMYDSKHLWSYFAIQMTWYFTKEKIKYSFMAKQMFTSLDFKIEFFKICAIKKSIRLVISWKATP
ncbi:hypothetical protein MHBO_002738 [Bonamia ostreae]|uniref:Uncharacterized protein n=1 Tax=Bonamia ostreae TaxID=126728 RepID=A0ABV2ANF5_9EUKA